MNKKSLFAILLALVLCLGGCLGALAEENTISMTDDFDIYSELF